MSKHRLPAEKLLLAVDFRVAPRALASVDHQLCLIHERDLALVRTRLGLSISTMFVGTLFDANVEHDSNV